MYELCVKSSFSAAHFLRNYQGKCENMHGHNWDVEIYIKGKDLNETGIVIDFKDIKTALKKTLQKLDHTVLTDLDFFDKQNPSCENIARYIFIETQKNLNTYQNGKLCRVKVWETKHASVTYSED